MDESDQYLESSEDSLKMDESDQYLDSSEDSLKMDESEQYLDSSSQSQCSFTGKGKIGVMIYHNYVRH